jgi:probable rRNA maturation factor
VKRPSSPAAARKRGKPKPIDPAVDVMVQSRRWTAQPRAASIVRKAIAAAAKAASTRRAELAIVLTDDSAIQALNREWRGHDAPTNVLSFPAQQQTRAQRGAPVALGDIVIAYQTTAREAVSEGKPFRNHLAHLAIHGFLHLLGYDHETDGEADAMERLEVRILKRIDVPDPYAFRDAEA